MKQTVTINIEGKRRSGKSLIGKIIKDYLESLGLDVIWNDAYTIHFPDKLDWNKFDRDGQNITINSEHD